MLRNIRQLNNDTEIAVIQKSTERFATMNALFTNLMNDEAGFIVSAELVMIATLGVLAMTVGLSEVAWNVNNELQDVGRAFGSMNQSFNAQGQNGYQGNNGGSSFNNMNNNGGSDIFSGGSTGEQ